MTIFSFKNKQNLQIKGVCLNGDPSMLTIVLTHGFRGRMSQKFIHTGAEFLNGLGYSVICFDATNHIGESGGNLYDFTLSGYIEDLDCVLDYCKDHGLLKNGFGVVGHSLGGFISLFSKHAADMNFLAFISSPLFIRKNSILSHPEIITYEQGNVIHFRHKSHDGSVTSYDISWEFYLDSLKFTELLFENRLRNIEAKKIFLFAENDKLIDKQKFYEAYERSSDPKVFDTILNASHNIFEDEGIEDFCEKLNMYIKRSDSLLY